MHSNHKWCIYIIISHWDTIMLSISHRRHTDTLGHFHSGYLESLCYCVCLFFPPLLTLCWLAVSAVKVADVWYDQCTWIAVPNLRSASLETVWSISSAGDTACPSGFYMLACALLPPPAHESKYRSATGVRFPLNHVSHCTLSQHDALWKKLTIYSWSQMY